jgi:hypothetical protein
MGGVARGPSRDANLARGRRIETKVEPGTPMKNVRRSGSLAAKLSLCCFVFGLVGAAGQSQSPAKSVPTSGRAPAQAQPAGNSATAQQVPPSPAAAEDAIPIPGDWPTELLYNIWNSSNSQASEALYAAAFAAGPAIIPDLQAALKDDRTAEFAAKSLAFIGGARALEILARLTSDPRDLGLKRFFYGALAEIDSPQATQVLLEAIANADSEPDRTVTEAAILALTVRTDAALVPELRELESKLKDPVVQDDLENAADVISARGKYLAQPANQNADYSLERAVRTYFIPALEAPPAPARRTSPAARGGAKPRTAPPADPPVNVKITHLTFSPDHTRALARVEFEIPSAIARYDMVLQKQAGNWRLASVWLGEEEETSAIQGTSN